MKASVVFAITALLSVGTLRAQERDSSKWNFNADLNFYLIPDNFFLLPQFKADKQKLHLEARYNYEDHQTVSAWAGYNFTGGKKLEYVITPMVGGVVGLSNGIAPGLEFTLTLNRFELYSESEYLFDIGERANNFYYNWSDLTYSPKEWWWIGISGQRTRLYQTELDVQRGLLAGAAIKNWELNTYFYNIGYNSRFVIVTVSLSF